MSHTFLYSMTVSLFCAWFSGQFSTIKRVPSTVGFFNPVIPVQIFLQSRNSDGYIPANPDPEHTYCNVPCRGSILPRLVRTGGKLSLKRVDM